MKTPLKKIVPLSLLALTAAQVLCSCGSAQKSEPYQKSGFYFDTIINLTLYGQDGQKESNFDGAFALAQKYDNLLSMQKEGSDINRINANPKSWVEVDPATIEVLKDGIRYSQKSSGSFDITVGKLSSLWNISDAAENDHKGQIPSQEEIRPLLSHIGCDKIKIDGNKVMLDDDQTAIDLGGIGKGYIADKMKEYLLSQGVKSGLINLGGNVLVIGQKPDKTDFEIGIQKPFDQDGDVLASVKLNDQTAVTSGIYQRYFKGEDGTIYHHMLNLKSGYPEQNDLSSVTIICRDSTEADALSTITYLKGKDEGIKFIESLDGVEAVFIDRDNHISYSSGIGKKIPFREISQ